MRYRGSISPSKYSESIRTTMQNKYTDTPNSGLVKSNRKNTIYLNNK